MKKWIVLLALGFVSCQFGKNGIVRNQNTGAALGTSYNIIYLADDELDFQMEIDSVFSVVNQSLSTYIPDSDISKINKGDSSVVVDKMFREVFELSRSIHEATKGYFDPTVGTLVNAWGFGPGRELNMDSLSVDSLLNYVGFNKVSITPQNRIVKENTNIYFDFNAIAKGYAIDRLADFLNSKGIDNFLVEVGGEVVAKGINLEKNKPWVVGIDDPQVETGRQLKLLINLTDRALASSGNYRKFRIDSTSGKKYVHTIDPLTGYTKNSNTLGVTILANNCATADGYATAFMAMDLDEAFKVINSNKDLEAYIIYLDEKGNTQEFLTSGFKKLLVK
ncbi:FAD:protein FMN transferase [Maribacter sp. PR1]|uniref:FAD:protein FMN transferase n=1 Tax=Maribacter cobaltidurans TaxID=1178778 RepID=A0ABU7IX69_9FLAO|nr:MULTISPECIES: FAD:protein FMN transferase [Maribacter]MDC6390200.1 FAD:protein FMN transferase [Maribacter sp. PR1]MEE1977590.1 FAD:protein FMN transferase [Maribacter cobaltidurans]